MDDPRQPAPQDDPEIVGRNDAGPLQLGEDTPEDRDEGRTDEDPEVVGRNDAGPLQTGGEDDGAQAPDPKDQPSPTTLVP